MGTNHTGSHGEYRNGLKIYPKKTYLKKNLTGRESIWYRISLVPGIHPKNYHRLSNSKPRVKISRGMVA